VTGESYTSAKGGQYFKCQGYSHVVAQCPSQNLLIKEVDNDEIETVIHKVTGSATNYNDVRVASIQLSVIKCPHTSVVNEDWRRSRVFYTYIAHREKL